MHHPSRGYLIQPSRIPSGYWTAPRSRAASRAKRSNGRSWPAAAAMGIAPRTAATSGVAPLAALFPRRDAGCSSGRREDTGTNRLSRAPPVYNTNLVRDELLDSEECSWLAEAQLLAERWLEDYNPRRSHSSLQILIPAAFAAMHGIEPMKLGALAGSDPVKLQA